MRFLIDQSADRVSDLSVRYPFVGGQLLSPLSRYLPWDGSFAIDNGAYSKCDPAGFTRFVGRLRPHRERCLWLAVPDVVGCARRTLEVFDQLAFQFHGWPLALVCQDGQESMPIPWEKIAAVFIGGTTEWKKSQHPARIIRAAKWMGKRTHVGRINTPQRFSWFSEMGVDTCDGSGASRYDWMLDAISDSLKPRPLLESACAGE